VGKNAALSKWCRAAPIHLQCPDLDPLDQSAVDDMFLRHKPDDPYSNCYSRNARAGSMPAARSAGTKTAANELIVITRSAKPKATGSRGLTLYSRFPISLVSPSAAAVPITTPAVINRRPWENTSRNKSF